MNIMDKPTLQEVKEYFKNAKEVKSLENNFIFNIDFESLDENINKGCDNYWCQSINESWVLLWSYSQKKYAEIISYKEPLYQLTAKEIKHAFENPQYLKDTFKECFETELEVGKWYVVTNIESGSLGFDGIGQYTKEKHNGGLFEREDAFNFKCPSGYIWRTNGNIIPATEKEVEEALIKEAIKRGFVKGINVKGLGVYDGYLKLGTCLNNTDGYAYQKCQNRLLANLSESQNVVIFENGIWAKILTPTYTIQEAESKFNIKIKAV